MIVGLTGKKRHGKGEAAGVLVREFGFMQIDFTDALNEMMMVLNPIVGGWGTPTQEFEEVRYVDAIKWHGYDGAKEKYPEIVALLQRMGTDVGRDMIDPDLWTKQWRKRAIPALAEGRNVVVSNVRFDNEATYVNGIGMEMGQSVEIWECVRPGYIHDPEAHKHRSEAGIDPRYVDQYIVATELEHHHEQVRAHARHLPLR